MTYLKLSGLHSELALNFTVPIMGDGIVRIVNELDKQSTFQTTLIAFRPLCRLGFKRINGKRLNINPQRSSRRR